MRCLVMVAYADSTWEQASPETQQEYFDAHHAFERAVAEHGRLVAGEALAGPASATTLRHHGTDLVRTDGPFVETAEQVGGFYLVDMPDLGTTLAAGALLPRAYAVEVRPVIEIPDFERSRREMEAAQR